MLKLTTENGEGATNTIYFEQSTLLSFLDYLVSAGIIDQWNAPRS